MNIDGLGDRIMEDFYNFHFIATIPDIYSLKEHEKDLIRLEGYGDKSVTNLLNAIEESKKNSLEKLIFGLGIPHVGAKTAKLLAQKYKTLQNLMEQTEEELTKVPDIGEIIAKSVVEYFNDSHHKGVVEELIELGINTTYLGQEVVENEEFSGKSFVLTGIQWKKFCLNRKLNNIYKRRSKRKNRVTGWKNSRFGIEKNISSNCRRKTR